MTFEVWCVVSRFAVIVIVIVIVIVVTAAVVVTILMLFVDFLGTFSLVYSFSLRESIVKCHFGKWCVLAISKTLGILTHLISCLCCVFCSCFLVFSHALSCAHCESFSTAKFTIVR